MPHSAPEAPAPSVYGLFHSIARAAAESGDEIDHEIAPAAPHPFRQRPDDV